ncbi:MULTISPECIES: SDR family NAD(P)-dependent oxidoreductase [unclassified Staphylococcus]|uniref:SDR family NAD(P)-dependent oxidoreductase n=1 Tax=Staphylococcus TaxID=1279 RepID=UPI001AEC3D5F|nr:MULTISPECIES: SDR family NAD(P)-dependent oxidoreductase [unclassified Staphylococcus]
MNKKIAILPIGYALYKYKNSQKQSMNGSGQYVLITGASSGLGKAFSEVFAQNHFNLVIVARSEDKLNALAEELRAKYKVNIEVVPTDLTNKEDIYNLYDHLKSKNITIDQLVNNAGIGNSGRLVDVSTDQIISSLNLNVISVALLAKLFGEDMVKRNNGKILNVASLGAYTPNPYFNIYGPSRSFVAKLTETMYGELQDTNVSVSALCPGPVDTNWAKSAGKSTTFLASDPKKIAINSFYKMQNNQLIIIPGKLHHLEKALLDLIPNKLLAKIIGKWQYSLIAQN